MNAAERKIAAYLLRLAADEFGYHGCNDFDLTILIPDKDERDEFVRAAFAWGGDPDNYLEQTGEADYRLQDWMLMSYMAYRLESNE